ncbi:MAG: hypothetical protein ACK53Y_11080, partial [bacterium]
DNYYYCLSTDPIEPVQDNMPATKENINPSTTSPPTQKQTMDPPSIITVEHSMDTISKLLKEFEADEPPTPMEPEEVEVTVQAPKSNSYCHRFAIYRRNNGAYTIGNPSVQLSLFKSFAKCMKQVDNYAMILPIHSDIKIYPLSTTDQINYIESIGVTNYFQTLQAHQENNLGRFLYLYQAIL